MSSPGAGVELFWLPLGAGGHSVRWNGRLYEAACALLERRAAVDLYHSTRTRNKHRWTDLMATQLDLAPPGTTRAQQRSRRDKGTLGLPTATALVGYVGVFDNTGRTECREGPATGAP